MNNTVNPGASYYAEVQYITPNEYAWCQTHPRQCNMYNNASYLRYSVGAGPTFLPVGSTVRMSPAINAWTGATINPIEPEPGMDGRAFIACKVTGPVGGVWHYEYALYNQNLDRGIQFFRVPLGGTITVSNLGFHAPLNHPGFANDGTVGDAGYSNAAWTSTQTASDLSWSSESFAENQNANAIRWGTLYNLILANDNWQDDPGQVEQIMATGIAPLSNRESAMLMVLQHGAYTAVVRGKDNSVGAALVEIYDVRQRGLNNVSTRAVVSTGDEVVIAGVILGGLGGGSTNTGAGRIVVRGVGPALATVGVDNPLANPMLELRDINGTLVMANDDWMNDPAQAAELASLHFEPRSPLEPAFAVTLPRGAYTVLLSGVNNGTGVGVIEIYDLNPDCGECL